MDFLEEIKQLEKKKTFIHFSYDHYDMYKEDNGSNCNFSIEIRRGKVKYQTSWHGDNHEYGDVHENMEAAVMMAKWFVEDEDRMHDFFNHADETETEEGKKLWKKNNEAYRALGKHMYNNHKPHREASDRMTKWFEEENEKENE